MWEEVGSIGTAIAVLVAAWQLRRNTRQATTDFEDDLSREYRELARSIPVEAYFGEDLSDEDFQKALPSLFQYIDLSNEQVFLRKNGRISYSTWVSWCDGIKSNLSRPAFNKAWVIVKARVEDSFEELRRLEKSAFSQDPRKWLSWQHRLRWWING
jgi:hypothetical protein